MGGCWKLLENKATEGEPARAARKAWFVRSFGWNCAVDWPLIDKVAGTFDGGGELVVRASSSGVPDTWSDLA